SEVLVGDTFGPGRLERPEVVVGCAELLVVHRSPSLAERPRSAAAALAGRHPAQGPGRAAGRCSEFVRPAPDHSTTLPAPGNEWAAAATVAVPHHPAGHSIQPTSQTAFPG